MKALENRQAEREDDQTWDGIHYLSVFACLRGPAEEEHVAVQRMFQGRRKVKKFRTSSLDQMAAAGFVLLATPPEPYHYDVALGAVASEEVVERFEACFGEAKGNPLWKS